MIVQLAPFPLCGAERAPPDGITAVYAMDEPASWLYANAGRITAVITHSGHGVSAALLKSLTGLRAIFNFGSGLDRIDLQGAEQRGILVTATRDEVSGPVADLAIGLALATGRRFIACDAHVRENRWRDAPPPPGLAFSSSRIGIAGFGGIGRAIAARSAAFGTEIGYWSRTAQDGPYRHLGTLVELAGWSDYLFIALPATSQTVGIVDAGILTALGPTGILINVARGDVIDEPALVSALADGTIAGAGLDVFATEPEVALALRSAPNTVLTPHIGTLVPKTRLAMADAVYAGVSNWLAGGLPSVQALPG